MLVSPGSVWEGTSIFKLHMFILQMTYTLKFEDVPNSIHHKHEPSIDYHMMTNKDPVVKQLLYIKVSVTNKRDSHKGLSKWLYQLMQLMVNWWFGLVVWDSRCTIK